MANTQFAIRPEVSRATTRIMSGAHFTCLLLDDKQQRAAALEAVLDQVTDATTRVVWVGNPLRSPLTIERFLMQIAGPEVDLRIERSPAQLVRLMTQPQADESRLLVIVQQPETMGAEARDTLAAIPAHLSAGALQMQFLFVGATSFTLMTIVEPQSALVAAAPAQPIEIRRKPLFTRLSLLLPLMLMLGAALGVGGTFAFADIRTGFADMVGWLAMTDESPAIAWPAVAAPSPAPESPPSPAPRIVPATTPVTAAQPAPPEPNVLELRREFDAFLASRASITPPMNDAQKDALFREFMAQRRR